MYLLEDGDEEVDEQNVGYDEVDGHDCGNDPAPRNTLKLLPRPTLS